MWQIEAPAKLEALALEPETSETLSWETARKAGETQRFRTSSRIGTLQRASLYLQASFQKATELAGKYTQWAGASEHFLVRAEGHQPTSSIARPHLGRVLRVGIACLLTNLHHGSKPTFIAFYNYFRNFRRDVSYIFSPAIHIS